MPPATRSRAAKKAAAAPPPPADDASIERGEEPPAAAPEPVGPRIQPADVDTTVPDRELNVYQAFAEVMRRIGAVGKDRTNDDQGFKFRGVDDLMNAAHPAMAAVGLICVPKEVLERHDEERRTRRDASLWVVKLRMRFTFYGPDGSSIDGEAWGEGVDNFDKATSKAHTMAYKTFLYESFHVPTREASQADPDSRTVEESTSVDPATERGEQLNRHFTDRRSRIHPDDIPTVREWWQSQGFPKSFADWTDEQVAAGNEKLDDVERARAEIEAQNQAGEGNEPPPQQSGEPTPEPTPSTPEDAATAAAVETVQEALGAEVVPPTEGPQTTAAAPTHDAETTAKAMEHRRRACLVSGKPNTPTALSRLWKDAEAYADVIVADPTNTAGAEMPLWRLFVLLGYPPAGAGRDA